jgi:hypothetical protein
MYYRDIDWILQWTATALTILGAVLTSLGGWDPWNVFAFYIGTLCWLVWAIRIRQLSLITVNGVLAVIYTGGFVRGVWSLL